jgi:hypothetical protein
MFRVAPLHPLHNSLLELVSRHPELSMAELQEHLRKKYKTDTSLQHLYRIVGQMMDEQILIKRKGKISLNLMWLSYLSFYAEHARKTTLGAQSLDADLPKRDGEKKQFAVHSLVEVETVWNHLLVQLRRILNAESTLHKYYSHAWWQYGQNHGDAGFYENLAKRGVRCRWLFGNDTYLDRQGAERIRGSFEAVIDPKPPFPTEGYNLNVYGDYVLECVFPDTMSKHLEAFFERVTSAKQFDREVLMDLFTMPCPCKVTLWKSKRQAELLRNQIEKRISALSKKA